MRKTFLLFALVVCGVVNAAVYEVGDTVENLCWKDVDENNFCLDSAKDEVRVLLYNTGWCPPCNSEFQELSPQVREFKNKPVKFISLSAAGWSKQSLPDTKFLNEWKNKHSLDDFVVAASPKDPGKKFFEPPIYIPNVAIIGKDGKLAYKAVNPGVNAILAQVRRLMKQIEIE